MTDSLSYRMLPPCMCQTKRSGWRTFPGEPGKEVGIEVKRLRVAGVSLGLWWDTQVWPGIDYIPNGEQNRADPLLWSWGQPVSIWLNSSCPGAWSSHPKCHRNFILVCLLQLGRDICVKTLQRF